MKTSNFLLSFCSLTLIFSLFVGCSFTKQAVATKNVFNFSYSPHASAAPGSAKTSIILINPSYASNFTYLGSELFNRYSSSFANDIQALLIARGFTLTKTYSSADEVVYSDKKEADIEITIEIDPTVTATQGQWKLGSVLASTQGYRYYGSTNLVGKINLVGCEPLTAEKIWDYSLDIPEQDNISLNTSNGYSYPLNPKALLDDPAVYNSFGQALQQSYSAIMGKIEAKFDPAEFQALQPQIQELKAKKGY